MAVVETEVPPSRVAPAPSSRLRPSRNLVIVRGGDGSLHRKWLGEGQRRDFDVFLSYYGRNPGRLAEEVDYFERRSGPKWPCIAELLRAHSGLVQQYDCVWFPDDDLATNAASIDRMFAFFHAYALCLAQPALTHDSPCTWRTLRQDRRCQLRFNRFVEIMAPMFSREALRVCAPSFDESASGWGLDWLWPELCRSAGLERIAVIDATPVRHTRPCGGELYHLHPELDPRADARRVLHAHGLQHVRRTAKYSFTTRVRECPLPIAQRFFYALRRLNGRRRHSDTV